MKIGVTYGKESKVVPYEQALRAVGLEPVRFSPEVAVSLDELSGVLITGGSDVDPERYGQAPGPHTGEPDRERDALESDFIRAALDADLPLLCICRGLQVLNVAQGGTLIQHLEDTEYHEQRPADASADIHAITVAPRTQLAEILGAGVHNVNSRHHQAADRVGDGLVVSARADDGVVEALELPGRRFALAVQWHPEDRLAKPDLRIFERFAEASRG